MTEHAGPQARRAERIRSLFSRRDRLPRLHDLSLGTILLLAILGCLCIPSLLLGAFFYSRSTAAVAENAEAYALEVLRQLGDAVDAYVKQVQVRAVSTATSEAVKDFLASAPPDPYGYLSIWLRLNREVFTTIANERPEIVNIGLVNRQGLAAAYGSHGGLLDTWKASQDPMGAFPERFAFLFGPWNPSGTGRVVTVALVIRSMDLPSARGVLLIDIGWPHFQRLFDAVSLGREGSLTVFDAGGRILHPDGTPPPAVPEPSERALTVRRASPVTGWTLEIRADPAGLYGSLPRLRNLSLAVFLALLAVALGAAAALAFSVTKALRALERGMGEVERGHLVTLPTQRAGREIAGIHARYNSMVGRLRELIEVAHQAELREKETIIKSLESRLLLYQSSIDPHFLHNTLEVINSYAVEEGNDKISGMIAALADLFRYKSAHPRELVTLREELDHLGSYLAIQRELHPMLRAVVRAPRDGAPSVRLPPLTLQPIVENSFVHGYGGLGRREAYIGVHGAVRGELFELRIRDRGRGILEDIREALDRQLALPGTRHIAEGRGSPDPGGRPTGLWNVHCRLRLALGDGAGLRIPRAVSRGTEVVLTMPSRGAA